MEPRGFWNCPSKHREEHGPGLALNRLLAYDEPVNFNMLFRFGVLLGLLPLLLYRGGVPFPAVLCFVFLATLLYGLVRGDAMRGRDSTVSTVFLLGTVGVFGIFLLSVFYSSASAYGSEDFFLLLGGLLIMHLAQRVPLEEEERFKVVRGWIYLAVLSTGVGVVYYLTLPQARFFGSFGDPLEVWNAFPNAYANFLLLLLPATALFMSRAKGRGFWAWTLILSMLLTGFFLALSRGAGLALFGTVFFAGLLLRPGHKRFVELLKKVAPTVFLTLLLVNGLQWVRDQRFEVVSIVDKVTFQADEGTASQDERIQFWRHSLQMMADKPWLGMGPESFPLMYPQYQEDFGILAEHPHNLFLKIGVEWGVIALVGVFLLVVFFWFSALITKRFESPFFWGLLACFLQSLVDYNLNFSSIVFVGAFFVGWLLQDVLEELRKKKRLPFLEWKSRYVFTGLLIVALFASGLGLYEFYYKVHYVKGVQALERGDSEEAERFFVSASPLIWDEDLVLFWAKARAQNGDLEGARALLLEELEHRSDARLYSLLGSFSAYAEAGVWFEKALALNPHNELEYYYDVLRTVGYDEEQLLALLQEYTGLLAVNAHNTLLTQNPEYADKLYSLLESQAQTEAEKHERAEAHALFLQVWAVEREKFEALYLFSL